MSGPDNTSKTPIADREHASPPKLFAELSMPEECHLSGESTFTFAIEYSTKSQQPITVDKSRSPLSVFEDDLKTLEQLIDCRDTKTGEGVSWSGFFGCGDSDPHPSFPDDDDFVEISADKAWRFECTLENLDYEYDTVRSVLGLEPNQTYKTQIAGGALSAAFRRWQYGRKEDLLSGSEEERKKRWEFDQGKLGNLTVERIGEPVVFKVLP